MKVRNTVLSKQRSSAIVCGGIQISIPSSDKFTRLDNAEAVGRYDLLCLRKVALVWGPSHALFVPRARGIKITIWNKRLF